MTPTHPESELVALLPCPWCGCKPELFRGRNSSYVACNTRRCKVQPVGLRAHPFPKAVSAWNSLTTRAATVPQGVWLPIESAPRDDCQRVLILKDCGPGSLPSVSVAYFFGGQWQLNDGHVSAESWGYRVTHWQPLPTPPPAELGKGDL